MRLSTLLSLVVLALPSAAAAQTYQVRPGDTLGSVAQAQGVDGAELARLNGLEDPDLLQIGQELQLPATEGRVVEKGVIHVIQRGVTLRRLAQAYKVGLSRIVQANKIRNPDVLRRGAEILIPGATEVVLIATKRREPCLSPPVEIYRVHTGETRNIVLTSCNGRVWEPGREEISHFLDRTKTQTAPLLNGRLLELIQRVSNRYKGQRIEVVSAYRPPVGERSGSRHGMAKALDFRVAGLPNVRLRDFVRGFDDVGVGYYPNSTFIHLDVREQQTFWVDWSGPGESPRYGSLDHDPSEEPATERQVVQAEASRELASRIRRTYAERSVSGAATPPPTTTAAP